MINPFKYQVVLEIKECCFTPTVEPLNESWWYLFFLLSTPTLLKEPHSHFTLSRCAIYGGIGMSWLKLPSDNLDLHLHQLDELPPLLNLLLNQTVELSDVVLSVNDKEHAYLVHQKEFEGGESYVNEFSAMKKLGRLHSILHVYRFIGQWLHYSTNVYRFIGWTWTQNKFGLEKMASINTILPPIECRWVPCAPTKSESTSGTWFTHCHQHEY